MIKYITLLPAVDIFQLNTSCVGDFISISFQFQFQFHSNLIQLIHMAQFTGQPVDRPGAQPGPSLWDPVHV